MVVKWLSNSRTNELAAFWTAPIFVKMKCSFGDSITKNSRKGSVVSLSIGPATCPKAIMCFFISRKGCSFYSQLKFFGNNLSVQLISNIQQHEHSFSLLFFKQCRTVDQDTDLGGKLFFRWKDTRTKSPSQVLCGFCLKVAKAIY